MADILGLERLSSEEALNLFNYLVALPQSEGGKDILGCLKQKLVTESEVGKFLVEHTYTTILSKNGWPKVPSDVFEGKDIFEKFEIAVLGRPAIPTKYDVSSSTDEELT